MPDLKVKKSDIGRYVRIFFNDVGAVDGLITKVDGPRDFRFISFSNPSRYGPMHNNDAAVIKLGKYMSAENSGL